MGTDLLLMLVLVLHPSLDPFPPTPRKTNKWFELHRLLNYLKGNHNNIIQNNIFGLITLSHCMFGYIQIFQMDVCFFVKNKNY